MYEEDPDTGEGIPVLNSDGTHATTHNYQDAGKAYVNETSIPDVIGSISNNISYKGLSLDFTYGKNCA